MRSKGWAFVHQGEAVILINMTRDKCRYKDTGKTKCRYKDTGKTKWCHNDTCASGCDVWEGRSC